MDGIIANPGVCQYVQIPLNRVRDRSSHSARFRLEVLVCRPGDNKTCLKSSTLDALRRLYSPTVIGNYTFPPRVPGGEYAFDRTYHGRKGVGDSWQWGLEDHYRYFILNDSAQDSEAYPGALAEPLKSVEENVDLPREIHDQAWEDDVPEFDITTDDDTIALGITANPGQADVSSVAITHSSLTSRRLTAQT